jgi:hypothetical protein
MAMIDPSGFDLRESVSAIQIVIDRMKEGEFSEPLERVSVYIGSIVKSWDTYNSSSKCTGQRADAPDKTDALRSSIKNSIKFARMNLDRAMAQALDRLIPRPRMVAKSEEIKRAASIQTWFDGQKDPSSAMLEHYKGSSIPLDKYLIAGQWGHGYLRARRINPEEYDRRLCELLQCQGSDSGRVLLNYGLLVRAIDTFEERALFALEEQERDLREK